MIVAQTKAEQPQQELNCQMRAMINIATENYILNVITYMYMFCFLCIAIYFTIKDDTMRCTALHPFA